ncbi:MAG TPA: aldo/keto reductase, partial [Pseudoneobacillus sp.]|nr:aldo/keto reductase [Pseudoneobacillus sp.]
DLISDAEIKPMVNQVEYHPHLTQKDLLAYCQKEGIQLEAWSPLKQGQLLNDQTLMEIAEKYGKSTAQVILRWDLQTKVVTIPKSIKEQRIIENANIFDFELSTEDMAKIDGLNKDERVGPDPDVMNNGF